MRSFFNFFVQVTLLLSTLLFDTCYGSSSATPPTPISHVQVTLKGKKYDIENVTTLSELQERIEEKSGIPTTQQGRILFQGKSLSKNSSATTSLSQAGVSNGDMLNCVPATSSSSSSGSGTKKKKSTTSSTTAASTSTAATTPTTKPDPNASSMKDMMEAAGVDTKAMEDMVNSMMGGGSGGGGEQPKMPSMEESMQMMSDMVKSPLFTQYMNDPEKLEQSRQMILNNPMLKTMMTSSMPGMEELLNDKDAWANAMKAAADMYSNMDSNDLMNAMMQGADARMGSDTMASSGAGGLFDGMMNNGNTAAGTTTPTALDELSEGED